jgi:hypothetical protein
MPELNPEQHSTEPLSPGRRPSRAAYALPTLFTSGNIFLGFLSVMQAFEGAMMAHDGTAGAEHHFEIAAKTIGIPRAISAVSWIRWRTSSVSVSHPLFWPSPGAFSSLTPASEPQPIV